jgi:multiple sugar transport system substrate-binding protein
MPDRWLGLYANNGQLEDLGPFMKNWPDAATLGDRAKQFGSAVDGKMYEIPYGFYVRAMFWNKKLFNQAGLSNPPATMTDFMEDAKKISTLPGKYGYCLRGGPGEFSGTTLFMNSMSGTPGYFDAQGKSNFNAPGSVQGLQFLVDVYQKGYAPKDSVNWGFNEIVAGFYSGTCAMLDQDPDALIGISDKMSADDFSVAPMPVGPGGKAYPTLGYGGWAMFANSNAKDASWKLMSFMLAPAQNLAFAKVVGTLPIHKGAEVDPSFASDKYKGWFTELDDSSKYVLVTPPTYLEGFGNLYDNISIKGLQQALLGQRTAKDVADEWAKYLDATMADYRAKGGKN